MRPLALAAFFVPLLACPRLQAEELRAGTAKVDITPPVGFPMWGYASRRDAASQGVFEPLLARALVLAAGKERIALVSLDLGRPPVRASTLVIRKRLSAQAGIEHVFLVASHTHHGPVLELDSWPDPKSPYTKELENKLTDLVLAAAKDLKPARLGSAAKETSLNRNRHSRLTQKPVDRELIVVRVEDAAGKTLAHLVNFAAHPTMIDAKLRRFSPDYPGIMAGEVERAQGGVCLFLQGAAGDLSPDPGRPMDYRGFGRTLAKEVLELDKAITCAASKDSRIQVTEREFTFGKRIDLGNPLIRTAFSLAFFRELVNFYEREYQDGIRPHLTTALVDGRIGLVGVSGEFFSGHALSLKRRARLEHLLFLGYCNDYQQYFPTIEAVAEGGYGAEPHVAPVEVGAGERIMDQALIDLYELRGKMRGNRKK